MSSLSSRSKSIPSASSLLKSNSALESLNMYESDSEDNQSLIPEYAELINIENLMDENEAKTLGNELILKFKNLPSMGLLHLLGLITTIVSIGTFSIVNYGDSEIDQMAAGDAAMHVAAFHKILIERDPKFANLTLTHIQYLMSNITIDFTSITNPYLVSFLKDINLYNIYPLEDIKKELGYYKCIQLLNNLTNNIANLAWFLEIHRKLYIPNDYEQGLTNLPEKITAAVIDIVIVMLLWYVVFPAGYRLDNMRLRGENRELKKRITALETKQLEDSKFRNLMLETIQTKMFGQNNAIMDSNQNDLSIASVDGGNSMTSNMDNTSINTININLLEISDLFIDIISEEKDRSQAKQDIEKYLQIALEDLNMKIDNVTEPPMMDMPEPPIMNMPEPPMIDMPEQPIMNETEQEAVKKNTTRRKYKRSKKNSSKKKNKKKDKRKSKKSKKSKNKSRMKKMKLNKSVSKLEKPLIPSIFYRNPMNVNSQ